MGSVVELRDAVKDTLDRKGIYKQLQAHIRSHVYKILLDAEEEPRPDPCNENLIINELIREYLIYNGYRDTLSVFLPESGQPQTRPFDRDFLVQQIGVTDTSTTQQVPLLYTLAARQRGPSIAEVAAGSATQSCKAVQNTLKQQSVEQQH